MSNKIQLKHYFSKENNHLRFEFYNTKYQYRTITDVALPEYPEILRVIMRNEAAGCKIATRLRHLESTYNVLIVNKRQLIRAAYSYAMSQVPVNLQVNYVIFDRKSLDSPPHYCASLDRLFDPQHLIINVFNIHLPLKKIDMEKLFTQAINYQEETGHTIIDAATCIEWSSIGR